MRLFSTCIWVASGTVAALALSSPARAQCAGAWVPNGLPSLGDMNVKALAVMPSDTGFGLIAGGQSSAPDRVRVLTGNAWTPLGGGVTGTSASVKAVAVLPDGSIVVGGYMLSAGSFSNQALLRWDGSAWSLPGGGLGDISYTVDSLLVEPDGGVIAGGYLRPGDTGPIDNLMKWNPSTDQWVSMSAGLQEPTDVLALARRPNGNIIAGGDGHICEWNGSSWIELASMGSGARVLALAVLPGGDVVAGGAFDMGLGRRAIARWDGSLWRAMPYTLGLVQFPQSVYSLAVAQSGDLIAAGISGDVVRWDGSTWSTVGPRGSGGTVYALTTVGSSGIVAGGDGFFPRVSGLTSRHIARYAPPTADFDQDGNVGTDADIESYFGCLAGWCCPTCGSPDFNGDGDIGTDADIEAFFRMLSGGAC